MNDNIRKGNVAKSPARPRYGNPVTNYDIASGAGKGTPNKTKSNPKNRLHHYEASGANKGTVTEARISHGQATNDRAK